MNRRALLPSLLGVALLAGYPCAGQAMDLAQAWRDALAHDSGLASAQAQLAATRQLLPIARAALLPTAGATGSVSRQAVDAHVVPRREFNSQTYGINLALPLVRLQAIETLEQNRLRIGIAEAQLEQARQDLGVRVAQAYFDVLAAQDALETLQSQKRAIAEQLAAAKLNFEVGTATITDQQEAQARSDLTTAQEIAAANELEVRRSALALLVGKPVPALAGLRAGLQLSGPNPAQESQWTESARRDALAVQQARLNGEVARREIDRQRFAYRPTVDLVSSVGQVRNPAFNLLGVNANQASIGVQVNMPLYTGGAVDAAVAQAAALRDKAEQDLESARRQVEQAARQSFLGVQSGLAQVGALQAAERSSELALESNKLGYQVGVRINIDVLNAQQQLYSTRRDLARARYDVLVNGLRLKASAGQLSETDLQSVSALLAPAAAR